MTSIRRPESKQIYIAIHIAAITSTIYEFYIRLRELPLPDSIVLMVVDRKAIDETQVSAQRIPNQALTSAAKHPKNERAYPLLTSLSEIEHML